MALPSKIARSIKAQARKNLVTGQRFTGYDQVRQRHFWSSQLFTPDGNGYIQAGEFDIFTTPVGQVGQGYPVALTDLQSSWKSANRVPDNQNLEISEIGVTILPITSAIDAEKFGVNELPPSNVLNAVIRNTIVAIRYLTNSIEMGLAQDFAQASGPMMGTQKAELAALGPSFSRFATNGFAAPGLRRKFHSVPILLQHGETFAFRYLIPRAYYSGGYSFQARLDFWATESFVEKS